MVNIFFNTNRKPLSGTKSIGNYKEMLVPLSGFYMIHESRIINMRHFISYDPGQRVVTLRGYPSTIQAEASRRHGKMLKDYLKSRSILEANQNPNLIQRIWTLIRG
ncbi:MAG: hypothetical protein ABI844_00520 [Saprospiraceae bacterium]